MDKKFYFAIIVVLVLLNSVFVLGASGVITRENCIDGIDNDGDELVDCADPDCDGKLYDLELNAVCEARERTCNDGFDNDDDGLIDCADPDCSFDCYCDGINPEGGDSLYSAPPGMDLRNQVLASQDTLAQDLGEDAEGYYLDSVYDNNETGLVVITYRYSGDTDDVDDPGIVHYVDENGDIVKIETLDLNDFGDYVSEDDIPLSPWLVTLIVAVLIIIAVLIFVRRHRRG